MPSLVFRPRPRHLVLCVVIFFVCLGGAAALGGDNHDTFGWRVAHDLLQAVAAAALAVGGVGGFIEWRKRERWRGALQVIAVDLLDQTIRHTGAITSRAAYILFGEDDVVREIDQAFSLPWSSESVEAMKEAGQKLSELSLAAFNDGRGVRERAEEVSSELATRADKLRTAAIELESHVEADQALPLLLAVTWLHRRVRHLTDEFPRLRAPAEVAAVLPSIAVQQIFENGIEVASHVQEPFAQLRRDLEDPTLLVEIAGQEELLALDAEHRREIRATEAWLDNWQRETDMIFREMNEGLAELRELLKPEEPEVERDSEDPDEPDAA